MARIGKRVVDAARPLADNKRYIVWDTEIRGFGLLVLPSGVKSYVFDYRNSHGVKRRATIAKVGTLTPEQARTSASRMADMVKAGGDPLAMKRERRAAANMGELFDAYLQSETFAAKADSTQAIDRGRIERHLRPLLGRKPVDGLSSEDVRRAYAAIRDGKTATVEKTGPHGKARVRGGSGTARKAVRLLSGTFTWAIEDNRAKHNPAAGVKVGKDGERDTILDGPDQYARLFRALATMEAEQRIRPAAADAIRIIALTGARRGEIMGLRWRHVDLKAGALVIPPASHKTGMRTGKPRVITLPAIAQEIVSRQPAGGAEDYVFRAARGEGHIQLSKPWRLVRVEADLPGGIGLHGLRHSLASYLAMAGAQASEIMTTLGHRNLSTSQKYIHWADDARAALAERAAAPALAGLAAASGQPEAKVLSIRRRDDG